MSPRRRLYPTLGAPSCRLHARAKTRILLAPHDFHSLQFTMMPTCELAWRAPKQLGGRRLPSSNPGLVLISAKRTWADPTRSARGPLVANLAAFWQQISPIVPVLPTVPTHKLCAVYNLAFEMAWKPNSPPAQSKLKGLSEAWPPRPLIDSMS